VGPTSLQAASRGSSARLVGGMAAAGGGLASETSPSDLAKVGSTPDAGPAPTLSGSGTEAVASVSRHRFTSNAHTPTHTSTIAERISRRRDMWREVSGDSTDACSAVQRSVLAPMWTRTTAEFHRAKAPPRHHLAIREFRRPLSWRTPTRPDFRHPPRALV
jgi:hypothetical protein